MHGVVGTASKSLSAIGRQKVFSDSSYTNLKSALQRAGLPLWERCAELNTKIDGAVSRNAKWLVPAIKNINARVE